MTTIDPFEPNIDGDSRPQLDSATIRRVLDCGRMQDEQATLRWSSNYTFLVTLIDADTQVRAVYKPQRGERPLWDFPDGTLCYREACAYAVSDTLGWDLIPPMVLRDGSRGVGSVQRYIEHDPDMNYFTLDESYLDDLRKIAAFDYIINNADRKGGHILQDMDGRLWCIDHGIAFHAAPKLRTVIWNFAGERIPANLHTDLTRLAATVADRSSNLYQQFDRLLEVSEISAFQSRLRRLIERREYPRPGPGPNYPWPPI